MVPTLQTYETATCRYFVANQCQSCTLLGTASGSRLETKIAHLVSTLERRNITPQGIQPPIILEHPWGSRHKVKLSVSGSAQSPIIGITRRDQSTQDLVECPLSAAPIQTLLQHLARFISEHSLTPYDIERRTGELKYIIVTLTTAHDQGIMRFVLRNHDLIPRIRAAIPELLSAFPWISAVSCNIQPRHAAILEGPEEVLLSEQSLIREYFGVVPLYFAPQSFMQVTPEIARILYARAAEVVKRVSPKLLVDLYCGVGGFALSAAPFCEEVYGVELSQQAIFCAERSAQELGYTHASFSATEVDHFVQTMTKLIPDMLIVNPPRRGLSEAVCEYIRRTKPQQMLYSSCNVETFADDVAALSPDYTLVELTPFDMFPMTKHWEVLGVLGST
jgi:23S rRNA (uracil747-C5)-methyltransferase